MNDDPNTTGAQPTTVIDLAASPDFRAGNATIMPSRRTIAAVESVTVEPRVMQVMVALHNARGGTLSRDQLIDSCWGGVIVGDDAINRAIAGLRRAALRAGANFEIETIPRIGYRLETVEPDEQDINGVLSRRNIVAGALGVAALGAAGGATWWTFNETGKSADPLIEQARAYLRVDMPDRSRAAIALLEPAARQRTDDAQVWGLLALALRNWAEYAPSEEVSGAVTESENAARRALAIDPAEPNALTALATIQPFLGDWAASERSLLKILEKTPEAVPAISHLTTLYQSAGLLEKSKQYSDRALALDPRSPIFQFRDAIKHWIFGNVTQSDLVIDRVLQVWPRHPAVWSARLMLFAYTGRADAGRKVLADPSLGPERRPPGLTDYWNVSLDAIEVREPSGVDEQVAAILDGARRASSLAVLAMMTLSEIGEVDAAYEVAHGYFLGQGSVVSRQFAAPGEVQISDQVWKRSMMLFTPATRALRQDMRFPALTRALGLDEFWRVRGYPPDYRRFDRRTA